MDLHEGRGSLSEEAGGVLGAWEIMQREGRTDWWYRDG